MDSPERSLASPTGPSCGAQGLHPRVARSQLAALDVTVEAGRHLLDDVALMLRQARDERHPLCLASLPARRVDAVLAALGDGLAQLDELLDGLDPRRLRLADTTSMARAYVPRQWGTT